MTADEIREFMTKGGQIDCGNDDKLKQSVLDVLEDIGLIIGFRRETARWYRYIYYSNDIQQVHMRKKLYGLKVISASPILCPSVE